jgi:hypothetical protein
MVPNPLALLESFVDQKTQDACMPRFMPDEKEIKVRFLGWWWGWSGGVGNITAEGAGSQFNWK